jgi:hypothetical protein
MGSEHDGLPHTADGVAAYLDNLTFHPEIPVPEDQQPPVPDELEDALVPRSFKLPVRLDAALQQIADGKHISKSALVRRYLEEAVAAARGSQPGGEPDSDALIPLSEALRALERLRRLPHTA